MAYFTINTAQPLTERNVMIVILRCKLQQAYVYDASPRRMYSNQSTRTYYQHRVSGLKVISQLLRAGVSGINKVIITTIRQSNLIKVSDRCSLLKVRARIIARGKSNQNPKVSLRDNKNKVSLQQQQEQVASDHNYKLQAIIITRSVSSIQSKNHKVRGKDK